MSDGTRKLRKALEDFGEDGAWGISDMLALLEVAEAAQAQAASSEGETFVVLDEALAKLERIALR